MTSAYPKIHLLAAALAIAILLPLTVLSQTESDTELENTIRAAVLSDPRSAEMSQEEQDAMIAALVEESETQGMTSDDILWRPQEIDEGEVACSTILCALNEAFGFDGSDVRIPIGLGVSSALLLFLIGMVLHRLGHHPVAGKIT